MASGENLENDLSCSFCEEDVRETGISMEGCDHSFCRTCFEELVSLSKEEQLMCPYADVCGGFLSNDILKYLITDDKFEKYIATQNEVTTESATIELDTEYTKAEIEKEKLDGWFHLQAFIKSMQNISLGYNEAEKTVDAVSVIPTSYEIQCSICIEVVEAGLAIVIKECLHMFCRVCLRSHVKCSSKSEVNCPHPNCDATLKPHEMKELCSMETYNKHYTDFSLNAVVDNPNMFHCLTPNCKYFVEFDKNSPNGFTCPICKNHSCRSCKVSHRGMSCRQYYHKIEEDKRRLDELKKKDIKLRKQKEKDERNRIEQQQNERLGAEEIQRRLQSGEFKTCPNCRVVIEKHLGCDHMTCNECRYEFYWSSGRQFK